MHFIMAMTGSDQSATVTTGSEYLSVAMEAHLHDMILITLRVRDVADCGRAWVFHDLIARPDNGVETRHIGKGADLAGHEGRGALREWHGDILAGVLA